MPGSLHLLHPPRLARLLGPPALLILALWSLTAAAQVTLLAADFNDKALNQPIGTGGAAVGEPVDIETTLSATVRDDVVPGKSMSLSWKNPGTTSSGSVRFQWLGGIELSQGKVSVSFVLIPSAGGGYHAYLRESELSQRAFGTLRFANTGSIWADDKTGTVLLGAVTWSPGQSYLVEWSYDLDAGTYDLSINGTYYLQGRPHGVDLDGHGLGAVIFGISNSSAPESRLDVDDILVMTPGELIFESGFEGGEPGQ